MFRREPRQYQCLSFVLNSSGLPEESQLSQYVLSSKPWQRPCRDRVGLFFASLSPEARSYYFLKGGSSGCRQGQNFYSGRLACLNQKSRVTLPKYAY